MVKEKNPNYPKAFKEINEIIKHFPEDEYNKIPQNFLDLIHENMDNNYEYKVENIDDFQNQEMLEETRIILSMIYRDYIALAGEKYYILKREKEELLQEEEKNTEKNNPDNVFKEQPSEVKEVEKKEMEPNVAEQKEKETETKPEESLAVIEYKESIFKRIINWLKQLFKKQ